MDIEVYASTSEEETFRLGAEFSKRIVPGDVVAFYGDLGAGKTEFIKGICEGLEVREIVSSPTFNIVNEYAGEDRNGRALRLFHIDLYRVETASELVEIGLEETMSDPEAVKLIEWAEVAEKLLPRERYDVKLTALDDENSRRIEVIHRDSVEVNGANGTPRVFSK
jgi:tRNA threonylcarbamoyladenosine biosynthesis protein TsaE